jgi:hypothetical protein
MFFYSEPTPVSHVDSNLKLFLDPSSPTGSSITLYNGAAVSSSGGVDTFYLDGVNDYANLTGSLNTITQKAFTISMWVKMTYDNTSKHQVVMTNRLPTMPTLERGLYIGIFNGIVVASIRNYPYNGPGEGEYRVETSTTREGRADDENWNNIVVTSDGGQLAPGYNPGGSRYSQNIKLFLNNLQSSGASYNQGAASLWLHSNTLQLGFSSNSQFNGAYSPYNGHISNILIYDRELSLAEIQQNYDAFKAKFGR